MSASQATPPPKSPTAPPTGVAASNRWATQLGLLVVIVVLAVLFSRAQPGFLTWPNLSLIFKYYSPVAVLALLRN
ncbi:MAG: hypothetical protein ACO1SX_13450 [Actinomycetota bacterium]